MHRYRIENSINHSIPINHYSHYSYRHHQYKYRTIRLYIDLILSYRYHIELDHHSIPITNTNIGRSDYLSISFIVYRYRIELDHHSIPINHYSYRCHLHETHHPHYPTSFPPPTTVPDAQTVTKKQHHPSQPQYAIFTEEHTTNNQDPT